MSSAAGRILPPARGGAWVLALLAVAACEAGVMETGEPVDIELTANVHQATVGDSIQFEAEAVGQHLAAIRIDFRDGRVDTMDARGANEAAFRRSHAYEGEGDFMVRAVAEEFEGSQESDELEIRVDP